MSTKTQSVDSHSAENTVQNEALQSANKDSLVYAAYLPEDDIYYQAKEVQAINPEDIFVEKVPNAKPKEMDVENIYNEENLDGQGAELDNEDENIGEEDDEDVYHSTGNENYYEMEYDHYD